MGDRSIPLQPPSGAVLARILEFLCAPYRRIGIAAAAASAVLAVLLYRFPPNAYHYLPACPIRNAIGIYCPGCGAARSLHALFHGDIAAAVDFNGLFVLLFPAFVTFALLQFMSLVRDNRFRALVIPNWILAAVAVVMILFGIARNLPYSWACFLAP